VAGLPLNWAMRKRRASFWSAVSIVIMKLLLSFDHYRRSSLAVDENRKPY
jgi:hypothetical protein